MKKLIVANWKMNPDAPGRAVLLAEKIERGLVKVKNTEVVIAPPFPFLFLVEKVLKRARLGAQNMFWEDIGPYTGEVSWHQLKHLKVKYVIVGHSERRALGEADELINRKLKAALKSGLRPIFCVGEKEGESREEILERQIKEGFKDVPHNQVKNIIIAYEPVWAIGTGKNCSVNETRESVLFIRKVISKLYNDKLADGISVLYGGSVNSSNSNSYIKTGASDGLLVGGASLSSEDFLKIVRSSGQI